MFAEFMNLRRVILSAQFCVGTFLRPMRYLFLFFWCSIGLLINLRSRQRTISQTLHSSFKILF